PAHENVAQKPALEANAEEPVLRCQPKEPPAVVKEAVVKDTTAIETAKSEKEPAIPNSGNSGNSGDYGNAILEDLENLISDHLVCSKAQRTVLALWLLHTYTRKSAPITPYLNISSPVEESGKS